MKVNEIFYSLQGEGAQAGCPAIFVRFSGCNLRCPFCDTDHTKGKEITALQILNAISKYPSKLVILTGGEPGMQLTDDFINKLHEKGYRVAVETNGTYILPSNVDWVTVSPKVDFVGHHGALRLTKCDELKVIFDGNTEPSTYNVTARYYYLQPCDTGNAEINQHIINKCIEFIKNNPSWRLSLQQQKILKVR